MYMYVNLSQNLHKFCKINLIHMKLYLKNTLIFQNTYFSAIF